MRSVRFSSRADHDLAEIADYSLDHWGETQALRYTFDLEERCLLLAAHPCLGRACDQIRPGLRRFEQGRHVIFYRVHPDRLRIVRILHEKMRPELHVSEEDEGDT